MNRLKELRKSRNMTQTDVARIVGIGQSGYSFWESGRSKIDDASLRKLATLYDVTVDYLLGVDAPPQKGVRIPVYRAVAAGIPIEAIEDVVDWEEIEPDLAASGKFFGLRIAGQSMEPRICDGDVVIVRQQEDVNSGDVAIVLVNGFDATCKRVKKDSSGIWLLPNNPAYEPTHYSASEIATLPVRIIGKVVELRGKL